MRVEHPDCVVTEQCFVVAAGDIEHVIQRRHVRFDPVNDVSEFSVDEAGFGP